MLSRLYESSESPGRELDKRERQRPPARSVQPKMREALSSVLVGVEGRFMGTEACRDCLWRALRCIAKANFKKWGFYLNPLITRMGGISDKSRTQVRPLQGYREMAPRDKFDILEGGG